MWGWVGGVYQNTPYWKTIKIFIMVMQFDGQHEFCPLYDHLCLAYLDWHLSYSQIRNLLQDIKCPVTRWEVSTSVRYYLWSYWCHRCVDRWGQVQCHCSCCVAICVLWSQAIIVMTQAMRKLVVHLNITVISYLDKWLVICRSSLWIWWNHHDYDKLNKWYISTTEKSLFQ